VAQLYSFIFEINLLQQFDKATPVESQTCNRYHGSLDSTCMSKCDKTFSCL